MNQLQDPTNNFEERLLDQLRVVVAERDAEATAGSTSTGASWARRPALRLALAGAGVAAIAGVTLIGLGGGDGTSAAYAVEPQEGGMVRVEIRSLEDAKGLEHALAKAGIQADVNYLPAGTACREPRFTPAGMGGHGGSENEATAQRQKTTMQLLQGGSGNTVFSISRDSVAAGQTLVLTASPGIGGNGSTVQTAVAEGNVAPCVQIPAEGPIEETTPSTGATEGGESESGPTLSRHGG